MKIQTYSIVAGSAACNAHCPYCVSKMTPLGGIGLEEPDVNWRNFDIGCGYAKDNKVSTVLITSKGEATLFPNQITNYLKHLEPYKFPFIELQTNGIALAKNPKYEKHMETWYDLGMTLIAVSIAHYKTKKNKEIFQPKSECYYGLSDLIDKIHSKGFSVRLSCTMAKGYIDDVKSLEELLEFARENNVEQLTIRSIERPEESRDKEISEWVEEHKLDKKQEHQIKKFLQENGKEIMKLVHGAVVYDLNGQNICLTNALTIEPSSEDMRQLIFFPDGHLRYDWQYKGAILL